MMTGSAPLPAELSEPARDAGQPAPPVPYEQVLRSISTSTPPPGHVCAWHAIGVRYPAFGEHSTVALMRCTLCHRLDPVLIAGKWSIAQVRGEDIEPSGPPAGT